MEYYDEIHALLNEINSATDTPTQEINKLTEYFQNESGKEMYLMFSEWLSMNQRLAYDSFKRFLPLICLLFNRLKKSSPLISQDYVDLLYHLITGSHFNPEQMIEIESYLNDPNNDQPEIIPFNIFHSLYIRELPKQIVDRILPFFLKAENNLMTDELVVTEQIAKDFFALPYSYQLSFARCSLIYPSKFKRLSAERLTMLLISRGNSFIQSDGIKLISSISSPSDARSIFVSVLHIAPFLPSSEDSRNAWQQAQALLSKMSEQDRFNSYQAAFENQNSSDSLSDPSFAALIHQIERDISSAKNGGIFRSPMVTTNLLPCALDQGIMSSPIGKTEVLLSILNFLYFILTLDSRTHCFRILDSPQMIDQITKRINQVSSAIQTAKKDNTKPKEKLLSDLKKINFGENMGMEDVDKMRSVTELAITRIAFSLNQIRNLIDH